MKIINIISILATAKAARLGQDPVPGTDIADADADTYDYDEDEEEASIINALMEHCGDETAAVLQCYGGDESAVMTCTNCAWEQLLASGVGCDGLEEEVEADYSACADVCKTECDNDVITLKSCGIPLFCDEEPTLEIA